MGRITSLIIAVGLLTSSAALAKDAPKKAPVAKKQPKAKAPPPKKIPPVSAEAKKKLALNMQSYKFGMTKEEVIANLTKSINEQYEEKIKATTDMMTQDRLRKDRKAEVTRIEKTYIAFDGKKGGWDVSIVEEEFAHNTGESMLEKWEKEDGKNNRRFFFFHEGKLYKMFIQLDVSILPEDKRNFETFKGVMTSSYGGGDVEADRITWKTSEFEVRAIDKLKAYGAVALVIEDPRVKKELVAIREAKAPPKKETNPVIKAIVDTDGSNKPDVKNNKAVDAVIQQHGGGKKN
ncbi:MAG: hypothetical protein M4D80_05155 [Myxococcota bacterium]|nr:hypothetical protein [Deltaproteobacteria bacterium]MDQ3334526.1 hypothetical protein [Myxococcota bacterium]